MSYQSHLGPLFDKEYQRGYKSAEKLMDEICANPEFVKDICENRHRGNIESKLAFKVAKAGLTLNQQKVLKFVADNGANGATCDEAAAHFNAMPNELSGRFSELKRDGKIKADGRRRLTRGGCWAAVCVIV